MRAVHIFILSVCTIVAFATAGTGGIASGGEDIAMSDDSCLLQYEFEQSKCLFALSKVRTMEYIPTACGQPYWQGQSTTLHTTYILNDYKNNEQSKPFSLFCTYKE